jgi:hypothetical protein
MTIFTDRELEFLASLRKDWARLYRNELVRLMKEDVERRVRFGIEDIGSTCRS